MLSVEQRQVLAYLREHSCATAAEVARSCLRGVAPGTLQRILSDLDWFGYVAVYRGPRGEPAALQLTDRGRAPALGA